MSESTKIVNLDDRRPKPAPPIPQHWLKRFSNHEPLSNQEIENFTREAGPHAGAWIMEIYEAGVRLTKEARLLKRESPH